MLKKEARKFFQTEREKLTEGERAHKSILIAKQLANFIQAGETVSIFLPISRKLELNTFSIIESFPLTTFCVSSSNFKTHEMKHFVFEGMEQVQENQWEIPEPISGKEINISQIDVVIIPMLICDRIGNRVGYGKGFYDRFLSTCKSTTLKVGINYFEPIDLIEDTDHNDIPLDICVTPESIYRFNRS